MLRKTIAITSGYFNPVTPSHIQLFKDAQSYGYHICVVNNDLQVKVKGSIPFMTQEERKTVLHSIRHVDNVILSRDEDDTIQNTLRHLRNIYKHEIIFFCNGGDVTECRESAVCKELGIFEVYGVGGKKRHSSSEFIQRVLDYGTTAQA